MKITPKPISGSLVIPPSKSHTLRSILFGALAEGTTTIHHTLKSPDTTAMIESMRLFGAKITELDQTLIIEGLNGQLRAAENVIDAGNSGQVIRFVGALSALLPSYTILTGDESIRMQRPLLPLLSALEQLGAFAVSSKFDGTAPIIIRGPLKPGKASLCGADSQPVSGLLIATSFLNGTTHLHVTNPGEKPWIDLTIAWLKRLGGHISHTNHEHYTIEGPLRYPGFEITIPGDFSAAAFPLVAALITKSTLTLNNLDMNDSQGDKKLIDVLIKMGAAIDIDEKNKRLTVRESTLNGMKINVNEMIDVLPILAVLGCFIKGPLEIVGGAIARKKESDRIDAITKQLRKMGAVIEEREDGLLVTPSKLKGARLSSHKDHRIAMALIVAALGSAGDSYLEGAECIAKSYPSFIADLHL